MKLLLSLKPFTYDHWVGEGIPDSNITLKKQLQYEVLGASIKEAFTRCISRKI